MKTVVRKLGENKHKSQKHKTKNETILKMVWKNLDPYRLCFCLKLSMSEQQTRAQISFQLPKILGFHAFYIIASRWN